MPFKNANHHHNRISAPTASTANNLHGSHTHTYRQINTYTITFIYHTYHTLNSLPTSARGGGPYLAIIAADIPWFGRTLAHRGSTRCHGVIIAATRFTLFSPCRLRPMHPEHGQSRREVRALYTIHTQTNLSRTPHQMQQRRAYHHTVKSNTYAGVHVRTRNKQQEGRPTIQPTPRPSPEQPLIPVCIQQTAYLLFFDMNCCLLVTSSTIVVCTHKRGGKIYIHLVGI